MQDPIPYTKERELEWMLLNYFMVPETSFERDLFSRGFPGEENAWPKIIEGKEHLINWRYNAAMNCFSMAADQCPNHLGALSGLAFCHSRIGDLRSAYSIWEHTLSIDPNFPFPYVAFYNHHAGNEDFEEALTMVEELRGIFPHDLTLKKLKALSLFKTRRVVEAEKELVEYAKLVPDDLEPKVFLSWLYESMARNDKALEVQVDLVENYDKYTRFMSVPDKYEPLARFEMLKHLPSDLLFLSFFESKNVTLYLPTRDDVKSLYANTLINMNRLDEAKTLIDDLYSRNPKDTGVINLLGNYYGQRGELEKAEEHFHILLQTKDKSALSEGYSNLGNVCMIKKDPVSALLNFAESIRQHRYNPSPYILMRKLFSEFKLTEVISAFESAIKSVDKDHPQGLNMKRTLGTALADLISLKGDEIKAKETLKGVIEILVQDDELGNSLSRIGKSKNQVFLDTSSFFSSNTYILKSGSQSAICSEEGRINKLNGYIKENGAKISTVESLGSFNKDGKSYMMLKMVAGENLDSYMSRAYKPHQRDYAKKRLEELWKAIKSLMLPMHNLDVDPVIQEFLPEIDLRVEHKTKKAWLSDSLESLIKGKLERQNIFSRKATKSAINSVAELIIDKTEQGHRSLIHSDFAVWNVMKNKQGYTLIDFENLQVGDSYFDLAAFLKTPQIGVLEDSAIERMVVEYSKRLALKETMDPLQSFYYSNLRWDIWQNQSYKRRGVKENLFWHLDDSLRVVEKLEKITGPANERKTLISLKELLSEAKKEGSMQVSW